jgi:tetratricopeptide (TPR) repeat protein
MSESDRLPTEKNAELARSLCQQAAQLHEQADYAAARALYERALTIQEEAVGRAHPDTARSLHGLAQVQMKQGQEALARPLLEEALMIQEEMLGPEHPDTAASLHTLGELESNLGNLETGLELMARAYISRQLALGLEHADTIVSLTLLSLMMAQQGDTEKAKQSLAWVLPICERALGEDHRTTARVLNGLGRLYAADEATRTRAQSLYERALSIYERLLGPDHPQTALVLNNLATLLSDMQEDDAALPLLERSLAVHERVYGARDWRTSFVLLNQADIHNRRGDYATARPLLERALIIRERAWGGRHPETVRCLRKLVATLGNLHTQGDEGAMQAGMAFYSCLTSLEKAGGVLDPAEAMMPGAHLDPDKAASQLHRLVERLEAELDRPPLSAAELAELETASALVRQADESYQQGDYASAAHRLEEALSLQERVLGEHHLDHVELLRALADTKERQGQDSGVLPLIQRVADIHIQVLGPDHPTTLLARSELMHRQAYEYGSASARPLQEALLQSMEDALGPDDPLVGLARQARELLGKEPDESATGPELPSVSLSEKREEALAALSAREGGPLAGLDEIDWHSLQHAYGAADDVPRLLHLLLSDDEEVRDSAWQALYGNIWHQGDVYQATSYAVPFLIRLLDSEDTPEKDGILAFLRAVATARPCLAEDHTWMEPVLVQQGHDVQAEIERARLYTSRTRQAVSQGLDTYLAHLNHALPHVRQAAADLLCAFPEHAPRILPALAAQIESEPEVDVKSSLVQSLGLYLLEALPAGECSPYIQLLADLLGSQENRRVRFAASAALVRHAEDGAPPKAIEVLEQAVARPEDLYPAPEGGEDASPLFADAIVEEVCAALSHLSVESRIPILIRLLERVTSPAQAHQVAVLLLDSVLLGRGRAVSYSGTPEASEDEVLYGTVHPVAADGVEERIYPHAEGELDAGALTPVQSQALQAVRDCPAIWSIRSNLLQLYGLPQSPTAPRQSDGSSIG